MKYFCLACAITLLAVSCKKDDDDENGGSAKTVLLTKSQWKYESGGVDQDKNGTLDFPFTLLGIQPCILDNTGTFRSNGTGTADEGPTKCDPSIPQTSEFTWKFTNNETSMNVSGSGLFGLGGEFKIVELSDTKFSISKDTSVAFAPGFPPVSVALLLNLKH